MISFHVAFGGGRAADGLPNLVNNLFERRFQVIKGGVHCFVFGFTFPDHSAHVQRTDEGLGIILPTPPLAPPPNATSLYLVDMISFHVAFGGGRAADGLSNLLNDLFERRFQVIKGGVH